MRERSVLLDRDDVLVFETEALEEDLEITGDILLKRLHLHQPLTRTSRQPLWMFIQTGTVF